MRRDARNEGLRWLEQAEADRHGAQLLLDGTSYHLACFVAQQIAEKVIKAFLYAQGEELVTGHSVEALCRWAAEFDIDFEQLRQEIAPPDGYYIPTRYPNGLPDSIPARLYTRRAAEESLGLADLALQIVRAELRAE
ncbi:MAG: HEPN domain-containing protein [Caldilinea sp.]|nr:HEPN domain-containing protein [Caldilinea sp.]MDW8440268.1 HEPN domain-containing protein [Caldilineaceae bacterium]